VGLWPACVPTSLILGSISGKYGIWAKKRVSYDFGERAAITPSGGGHKIYQENLSF
jgi:hypothetical protein